MAPPQWCTFIPAWDVVHFYPGRTPGTTTNRTTKEDDTAAISWRTFIPAAGALDKMLLANPSPQVSGALNDLWSRVPPTCRRGPPEVRQQHLDKRRLHQGYRPIVTGHECDLVAPCDAERAQHVNGDRRAIVRHLCDCDLLHVTLLPNTEYR